MDEKEKMLVGELYAANHDKDLRSVVTKDIPSDVIAVGNLCKPIKEIN